MQTGEKPGGGIGTLVAALLAVALAAGVGYEQLGRVRDRERFPQIGRSVDIGGRSLNLFCSGTGAPAVVFEIAAPRPGYSWVAIQRQTAKFTQACWYDPAGLGWSDLGPYPRTAAATAADLHALVQAAGIAPPYLLVAETMAALTGRVYTARYPEEVGGLVFVDGVHPDLPIRMPQIRGKAAPIQKYVGYPQNIAAQVFNQIGLLRLQFANRTAPPSPPGGLTQQEWAAIWRLTFEPMARTALMQELPAVDESISEARASGTLGDRPLVVVSRNHAAPGGAAGVGAELQADLVQLSTRGKQVLVPAGEEPLLYRAPGAVADAVRDVVERIRRGPSAR